MTPHSPSPVRAEPRITEPAAADGKGSLRWTARFLLGADEPVFAGHYPGLPIFPGVCLVECAHRAVLAGPAGSARPELAAIESCRFRSAVLPGDEVTVTVRWDERVARCRVVVETERGTAASIRLRYREPDASGSDASGSARDGSDSQESDSQDPAAQGSGSGESSTGGSLHFGRTGSFGGGERRTPDVRIDRLLPHRYPMLLVDRVIEVVPKRSVTAVKAVTANEPWYGAGDAVERAYPGTVLLESWCQAAALLAVWEDPHPDPFASSVMLFGGMADVEFPHPVLPGSVVQHHAVVARATGDAIVFHGGSSVDGREVLRADRMTLAFRPADQLVPA